MDPQIVRLIQITDTHIFADPQARYDGVDTHASLRAVLELARRADWPPDAVIVTGDLVEDVSDAAYQRLRGCLQELQVPIYCIPGNHDDPARMQRLLMAEPIRLRRYACFADWHCVFLDTHVEGTHAGRLGEHELAHLAAELAACRARHALVCLHHPPVPIGSPWMDRMGLENSQAFFAILDRYPQVRVVLWGHTHQEFAAPRRGVLLLGAPSTGVQFEPGAMEYQKALAEAGYRWLRLSADGSVQTGIRRVSDQRRAP